MFETLSGYFAFVIPATALLILGVIFEDKLVDFEDFVFSIIKNQFKKIARGVKKIYGTAYRIIQN